MFCYFLNLIWMQRNNSKIPAYSFCLLNNFFCFILLLYFLCTRAAFTSYPITCLCKHCSKLCTIRHAAPFANSQPALSNCPRACVWLAKIRSSVSITHYHLIRASFYIAPINNNFLELELFHCNIHAIAILRYCDVRLYFCNYLCALLTISFEWDQQIAQFLIKWLFCLVIFEQNYYSVEHLSLVV